MALSISSECVGFSNKPAKYKLIKKETQKIVRKGLFLTGLKLMVVKIRGNSAKKNKLNSEKSKGTFR